MTAAAATEPRGATAAVVPLPPADPRPAAGDALALSGLALRLANGDAGAAAEVDDWPALFALARRERLAALAWTRCGAALRERADATTVRGWRTLWAESARHSEELLDAYGAAAEALAGAGVRAVVLKGAPLASALYGDAAARCSDDVDCFVAVAERAAASRVLHAHGWRSVLGAAPGDETFTRPGEHRELRIELHSSLVSERLAHLPVEGPASDERTVAGRRLTAHDGALLPGYLAAHLATHFAPPLLWWLDLRGVWSALDAGERRAAHRAAEENGLGRYLAWALRGVAAVERALGGQAAALRRIGVRPNGRRDVHQLWRHLQLAPGAGARVSVLREWARPAWAAENDGGALLGTLRRAARHWRSLVASHAVHPAAGRRSATVPPARSTEPLPPALAVLTGAGLLDAARRVTAVGGELTLTLTGESMAPTLRPGDHLLLGPLAGETAVGDIVLVALGATRPVIHRVVQADSGRAEGRALVRTRGDACLSPDPAVPADAVVARLVASERDGTWVSHGLTLRFGPLATLRGAWLALRARAAYHWRRTGLARPRGRRPAGAADAAGR